MTRNLFGDILSANDNEAKMTKLNDFKALRCGDPKSMQYEKKVCCDLWRLPKECQKNELLDLFESKESQTLQDFEESNRYKGSCELPDTIDINGNFFISYFYLSNDLV